MASTLQPGVACWPAPTQSVTPGRALFAKGLAKGCTSAHLQSIFSAFGTVTDCQIARHRSGRSAGFAIVTFLRHEEAVAAMQAMDNFLYMGRRLSVKWFSPERALEGGSHNVDVLNMQTLQHALQLSALQPADLMAQLAQMLESPRMVPQQPQNPHVAAWLDNFILAQQRGESPMAPPLPDPAPPPSQLDLLNLSALSLQDLPAPGMPFPAGAGFGIHPANPSSLDLPDGAVFVTATANPAANNKAGAIPIAIGGSGGGNRSNGSGSSPRNPAAAANAAAPIAAAPGSGGNNTIALAQSRLARWCTAPGSAGCRSSGAQSFADDASSDESASVHASDDSSVATTTAQTLALASGEAPTSCSTEGSSPAGPPALMSMSEAAAATALTTVTMPGAGASPTAPLAPPGTPASATCGAGVPAVTCLPTATTTISPEGDDFLRSRAYAAAAAEAIANSRPGVIGSDPGTMQQQAFGGRFTPSGTVLPGVPSLPPLRTAVTSPPAGPHHGHHHHYQPQHHVARMHHHQQHQHQGRGTAQVFTSCGGVVGGAGNSGGAGEASLQQALRLQQALAEQARALNAQQQYVDALAKLAAARDQVVAAASLLNSSGGGGGMAGLPMPPALATSGHHHPQPHNSHHHHNYHQHAHMAPQSAAAAAPISGYMTTGHMTGTAAAAVNQYCVPSAVPDLGTLLMFQNSAAVNRPLY